MKALVDFTCFMFGAITRSLCLKWNQEEKHRDVLETKCKTLLLQLMAIKLMNHYKISLFVLLMWFNNYN